MFTQPPRQLTWGSHENIFLILHLCLEMLYIEAPPGRFRSNRGVIRKIWGNVVCSVFRFFGLHPIGSSPLPYSE